MIKRFSIALRTFLLFLISLAVVTTVPLAAYSEEASHKGLRLTQRSESSGVFEIWIAADAVRVSCRSAGFVLAAKAPSWVVQTWRVDRKEKASMPFAKYLKSDLLLTNRISYAADMKKPKSEKHIVRGDDKLIIYDFPPIEAVGGAGVFTADAIDGAGNRGGTKLLPELISLDLGYAKQVGQVVSKLHDLADLSGVPIAAFYSRPNRRRESILECQIYDRKFSFKDSALTPPSDYHTVPMDKKLFLSGAQSEVLDEMYDTKMEFK